MSGPWLEGAGIHTGTPCRLRLEPRPAGSGIVFCRADIEGSPEVRATAASVASTNRATTLSAGDVEVRTVEHVLAALHATGRWDARVVLDGPEPPIGDGSALPFLALARALPAAERAPLRPTHTLEVRDGTACAFVEPAASLSITIEVDLPDPIGRAVASWNGEPATFESEIAPARTFAFEEELRALWAQGLALGARPGTGVLFSPGGLVEGGPLRFANEPARHKLLDLCGDLALLGAQLAAHVRVVRGGHGLGLALVRALEALR